MREKYLNCVGLGNIGVKAARNVGVHAANRPHHMITAFSFRRGGQIHPAAAIARLKSPVQTSRCSKPPTVDFSALASGSPRWCVATAR